MGENKIAYMPEGKVTYRDYMFLASMIKVRSRDMITFERLEQVLNAGDADTAARLLVESGWPNMIGMSEAEIDRTLNERKTRIFKEIGSVIPEDQVIELFRLKYDYHNAKAIIKGEGVAVAPDSMLSTAGRVSPKALKEAYHENDFRFMPPTLSEAMREAKAVLARTQNPQLADFVLDKAYFKEMGELAAEVEPNTEPETWLIDAEASIPFMEYYKGILVDCANLRTCVRCIRMGRDTEFLKNALIEGGNVSVENMLNGTYSGDGLLPIFLATPLQEAASLGTIAMKGGTMTAFEKECDNGILRYLSNTREMYFGSQLVVWYLAVEETNIVDVRMILTGLKAGISPEHLRERLRETYV